ncbi:MAG: hypothetical protein WCD75_02015, partial [Rhodoplanes sp.]
MSRPKVTRAKDGIANAFMTALRTHSPSGVLATNAPAKRWAGSLLDGEVGPQKLLVALERFAVLTPRLRKLSGK